MNERILNTLTAMGFQPEAVEDACYAFHYEGVNFLYLPSDDDDFLNIAVPAIWDIDDKNSLVVYKIMDMLNATAKYVKANMYADEMWLFYERELIGDENLEEVITRMIVHLEGTLIFFRNTLDEIANTDNSDTDDDGSPDETDETDETDEINEEEEQL